MIKDYFKMAFGSFRQRKMRAWLTMIGIFIGITAVVAIISLGQGLDTAITEQFAEMGVDKIFVSPGSSAFGTTAVSLDDSDRRVIEETQGIVDTLGFAYQSGAVSFKDESSFVLVAGYTLDDGEDLWNQMFSTYVEKGRTLEAGDSLKAQVGYDHSQDNKIWSRGLGLGDKLTINGYDFQVVGIQEKIGNSLDDGTIQITDDAYERVFEKNVNDEYANILARVDASADPEEVADRVEKNLRKHRGVDEGDEDFTLQTAEELMSSFGAILDIVNIVIVGIAAISLFIGGVGIMNTMYTAVVERTQEIGIMKAIGARNKDVLILFLIESGLLGAIGGAIGVALGLTISKAVEYLGAIMVGTPYLKFWWSPELVIGAIMFGFILGSLSGLAPAYQASKKNPVDALQYE